MDPGTVSAIISVASGVAGFVGQRKASKAAERAGDLNAENIRAETAESARRLEDSQKRALASGRAAVGASGVKPTGSPKTYLDALEEEQGKELDWLRRSGASAADIARAEAKYTGASSSSGGIGNLLSGIRGAISDLG